MAKLIWTEESLVWLKDIGDYLSSRNPQAAAKVTEGIYNKTQMLLEHPRIGGRFTDINEREVRALLYGHYQIVYEVTASDNVYVLAIFHSAMDIDSLEF